MKKPLKILYISSEVHPFSKTGGLGDVSGSLPKAIASLGHEVVVVSPFYREVQNSGFEFKKAAGSVKNKFTGIFFGFDIFENPRESFKTIFVKNDKYFARDGIYGTKSGDYFDNALRFGFLCKSVFPVIENIKFTPDVIHCNDWQTALVPLYLKTFFADKNEYKDVKSLFTIHNFSYQGIFSNLFLKVLNIPQKYYNEQGMEFYGRINFMKSGLRFADAVNTVSDKYAHEIMTPEYGCGLDGYISRLDRKIYGILNGIDHCEWDPMSDLHIKAPYDAYNLSGKKGCKEDLIERMGLEKDMDKPILAYVGRLVHQKGVDLIINISERILKQGGQIIILGMGDMIFEDKLRRLEAANPSNMKVNICFDNDLAHKIEAGSDIFIMPSRFEPCGLNQMFSLKYGTVPVVRATGGLDDVVVDTDDKKGRGNGFKYKDSDEGSLFYAVSRAMELYKNKDVWSEIMVRGMESDFSWKGSAEKYVALYREILKTG